MSTYSLVQAKDQLSKLIDEALSGAPVTITRHGKPVVHLTPARQTPRPMTKADLDDLAAFRATMPFQTIDSATLLRAMRDEEPE